MKSRKVESDAKVTPGLIPHSAVTNSFDEKGKYTHMGSREKSVKLGSEEFPEVYAMLKADLLEDIDAYANFVDSVRSMIL